LEWKKLSLGISGVLIIRFTGYPLNTKVGTHQKLAGGGKKGGWSRKGGSLDDNRRRKTGAGIKGGEKASAIVSGVQELEKFAPHKRGGGKTKNLPTRSVKIGKGREGKLGVVLWWALRRGELTNLFAARR